MLATGHGANSGRLAARRDADNNRSDMGDGGVSEAAITGWGRIVHHACGPLEANTEHRSGRRHALPSRTCNDVIETWVARAVALCSAGRAGTEIDFVEGEYVQALCAHHRARDAEDADEARGAVWIQATLRIGPYEYWIGSVDL